MSFQRTTAAREKVKLMLGLSGPSGSGKTFSALQMAYGITGDWKKIALADTENKSALYYAGERTGPWEHFDFPATYKSKRGHVGYHPENWMNLISDIESDPQFEVLILDSISHAWEGSGGVLELVDELGVGARGNNFGAGWKIATPLHRAFIDRMRSSRLHVLATMRSKQDYIVELNDKGKSVPKKVGTKTIQREGTDYEFGIIFDVNMSHHATASKDRTGLFAKRAPFKISPETGAELLKWANSGVEATQISEKLYDGSGPEKEKLRKFCEEKGHNFEAVEMKMIGRPFTKLNVGSAVIEAERGAK